jgi:hypothetical protein
MPPSPERALLEAEAELYGRQLADPLRTWQPTARQRPFIKAVLAGTPPTVLFAAGNRSGKSSAAAPWPRRDRYEVRRLWVPRPLRCLVVGEGPGFRNTSPYFYQQHPHLGEPKKDPVEVRGYLLDALHAQGLVRAPTLEAFRDGGFLFDHALRAPTVIPANDRTLGRGRRRRVRV